MLFRSFDYIGKEFTFNYSDFKIHLKTIDSLMMRIPGPEPLPDGRIPLVAVKSVIQNMTGYLEIDRPDNKSSVKKSPEFPRFKSDQPSYVYYDYPEIYGGVYKRDRFYFKLDPFEIDSLDNFDPSGLNFDGTFVSAGIFPDMRERLVLQQDNSLGFKKELDDAGSTVYAGKGRYYEKIKLDNSGLTGGGKLDYLASTSLSKSFVFFPDSTNATAVTFDQVRKDIEGVQYPQANGSDITMNWRPGEDKMMLYKNSVDFTMYGGQVDHNGDLTIAKTGTTGRGALAFDKAGLTSSLYKFKGMTFSADTSDFSLKSKEEGRPALSTTNMKSFVDLDKRFGEFTTNGPGSYEIGRAHV